MAGATGSVIGLGLPSVLSATDTATDLPSPDVPIPDPPAPDVSAWLAVVLGAARVGGLFGVSSEQALQVIEAAEAVKAWADAVAIDATAAMITELESDFQHLGPDPHSLPAPSGWERRRFLRVLSHRGSQGDPGRDRAADHPVSAPGVAGRMRLGT